MSSNFLRLSRMLPCAICRTPNANLCETCCSIAYCSWCCCENDKPIHELICQPYCQFISSPRPPNCDLAMLFPVASTEPKLIWRSRGQTLQTEEVQDPVINGSEQVVVSSQSMDTLTVFIGTAPAREPYNVFITHRNAPEHRINHSILNTAGAKLKDRWAGSVILHAHQDIDPLALSTCIKYLRTTGPGLHEALKSNSMIEAERLYPSIFDEMIVDSIYSWVPGVSISCKGDCRRPVPSKIRPAFVKESIADSHPLFGMTVVPTAISQLVGVPLLVRKEVLFPTWSNQDMPPASATFHPLGNDFAAALNVDTDPDSGTFGRVDVQEWGNSIGRVLVARADKKPLTKYQVQAFCWYCRGFASDVTRLSLTDKYNSRQERMKIVRKYSRRDNFEAFWRRFRAKGIIESGDTEWENEVSMFDTSGYPSEEERSGFWGLFH